MRGIPKAILFLGCVGFVCACDTAALDDEQTISDVRVPSGTDEEPVDLSTDGPVPGDPVAEPVIEEPDDDQSDIVDQKSIEEDLDDPTEVSLLKESENEPPGSVPETVSNSVPDTLPATDSDTVTDPVDEIPPDPVASATKTGTGHSASSGSQSVSPPESFPRVSELPPEYPRPGLDRFRRLAVNCDVRSQPRQDSATLYALRPGRVLWVEQLNTHWYVVYRKNGAAFVSPQCFNVMDVSQVSWH